VPHAAALLPSLGKRAFLTTGRTSLAAFADLDLEFLVRCVDPPAGPCRPAPGCCWTAARSRSTARALLREHRIDVLVTKDSGGPLTSAKLAPPGGGRAGCWWCGAPRGRPGGGRSTRWEGRPGVVATPVGSPLRVTARLIVRYGWWWSAGNPVHPHGSVVGIAAA
jgi:hypothetical protein